VHKENLVIDTVSHFWERKTLQASLGALSQKSDMVDKSKNISVLSGILVFGK